MKPFLIVYMKETGKKGTLVIRAKNITAAIHRFFQETDGVLVWVFKIIELSHYEEEANA